jgi:hypothetical protein
MGGHDPRLRLAGRLPATAGPDPAAAGPPARAGLGARRLRSARRPRGAVDLFDRQSGFVSPAVGGWPASGVHRSGFPVAQRSAKRRGAAGPPRAGRPKRRNPVPPPAKPSLRRTRGGAVDPAPGRLQSRAMGERRGPILTSSGAR